MNIGIYIIKNTINGKVYIGQSVSLRKRKYEHFRKLRNNNHQNKHLQASWNKYGEQVFVYNVIEAWSNKEFISKQELTQRELYYIDKFNCADSRYGYNKNKPDETNTAFTFSVTEETKRKIQDSNPSKKIVFVWNKSDNSFVGEFVSISDAANKLGIKKKAVYDSLAPNSKTKRRSVGGYLFTFTEEPPRDYLKTGPKLKPITIDGVNYSSYKEASVILGIKECTLRKRQSRKIIENNTGVFAE